MRLSSSFATRRWLRSPLGLAALVVAACTAYVLFVPAKAEAYTAAEINARIPDAAAMIVDGMETPCTNRLAAARANGGTPRSNVNESGPYGGWTWISPQGAPNTRTITVPYGTTAVNLQLNSMTFICAIVVENNRGSDNYTDPSAIVNHGNFPNDRRPNSGASDPSGVNVASRWQDTTRASAGAADANGNGVFGEPADGSVSNPVGHLTRSRDVNSRYWFSAPLEFTYNASAPITSSQTIVVKFNMSTITTYHNYPPGGTTQCTSPSGQLLNVSPTDFDRCESYDDFFAITINVGPRGAIDDGMSSCSRIYGWAEDQDSPDTPLEVHVYKDYQAGTAPPWDPGNPFGGFIDFTTADATTNQFEIDISGHTDAGQHTFYVYLIGVNSSGVPDGMNPQAENSPFVVGPCLAPSCGNLTLTPSQPEPGQPFTARVSFSFNAATPSDESYNVRFVHPGGVSYGGANPMSVVVPAGTRNFSVDFSGITGVEGRHTGQFELTGAYNLTCTFNFGGDFPVIMITRKPYIRAYGGDVFVGGSFAASGCTNPAEIKTYNQGPGAFRGSGAQFAAQALGRIEQFTSATLRSSQRPTGLSFANSSVPVTYPNLGGNFGAEHCVENWFNKKDASLTSPNTGDSANLTGLFASASTDVTHLYYDPSDGALNISTNQPLRNGKRIALFVEGNVSIESNITYESWSSIDSIPSFYLVVKGNIYIAPGVSQLDGVYIAQPTDPSAATIDDGKIITCASDVGEYSMAEWGGRCSPPAAGRLTVNGAFIAQQVKLHRLAGTMQDGNENEFVADSRAAEVFNYGPEVYLAQPPFHVDLRPGFDSITSLPPIF